MHFLQCCTLFCYNDNSTVMCTWYTLQVFCLICLVYNSPVVTKSLLWSDLAENFSMYCVMIVACSSANWPCTYMMPQNVIHVQTHQLPQNSSLPSLFTEFGILISSAHSSQIVSVLLHAFALELLTVVTYCMMKERDAKGRLTGRMVVCKTWCCYIPLQAMLKICR